ncbi:MAG: IS5/IS1182 family transposase, partial [SAR324 cluster bacterium]|nr:IS5/IS1182 family transposase [SAR324 cluster bacterium]
MRGQDTQQAAMFSYVSLEERIPADHPLRAIRAMADRALRALSPLFDKLYAPSG